MITIYEKGVYLSSDGGSFCNGIYDKETDTHIPSAYVAVMFNNMLYAIYDFLTMELDLSEKTANREIERILRVDKKDLDRIIMEEFWCLDDS